MGDKPSRYVYFSILSIILMAGCFSGGILLGWALPAPNAVSGMVSSMTPVPLPAGQTEETDIEDLFSPFWESWDAVHTQYVDQPVDDELLMQGAIRGMLDSLGDAHTSYLDPEDFRQMNVHNSGEYEGIGAWVNIEGEHVIIVSPMTGSPAERAGLKPNDVIIGVDGKDVTGIDGSVVLDMILGPAGTKIVLTIQRESVAEPFDVEIIREKITIPSVEGEMLEDDIAYIRINTFGEKTTSELKGYLKDLMGQDPVGLVVDLRNNGGGYVQTCIEVVSQFIPGNKVVMYEEYGDGTRQTLKSYSGGLATDIPLVVLVNEGTASASEIMAGAIQDYDRGVLVGVTTFGKGSVQNLIPLSDDQGAIRVTVARWLTPSERHIHEIGLDPDYVVELTDEDIEAEQDPQLDKAIQLILGGDTQLN